MNWAELERVSRSSLSSPVDSASSTCAVEIITESGERRSCAAMPMNRDFSALSRSSSAFDRCSSRVRFDSDCVDCSSSLRRASCSSTSTAPRTAISPPRSRKVQRTVTGSSANDMKFTVWGREPFAARACGSSVASKVTTS